MMTSVRETWEERVDRLKSTGHATCLYCHSTIDTRTDDNYNADHSKIQCPSCGTWWWNAFTDRLEAVNHDA